MTGKVGGNTANFISNWKKITNDAWVISSVSGIKIPLKYLPFQGVEPRPISFSEREQTLMQEAVKSLSDKNVIELCDDEPYQFISNIFMVPKQSGKVRIILDLSRFNDAVDKKHFKMTNIQTALTFVFRDIYMSSIDLQDAYFTFPIVKEDRKFLKFRWQGVLWRFRALPMGITCAPLIFTKLITPIFAFLHKQGVECFPYLDDSFICGHTEMKCWESTKKLAVLLVSLGFKIHLEKSALLPSQTLLFLGVVIDSKEMKIFLPTSKIENVKKLCEIGLKQPYLSIRYVLHMIGTLNSYSVAVEYGGNHFKNLERDQITALKQACGNFDSMMSISDEGKQDLRWWLLNIEFSYAPVRHENPCHVMFADASNLGWGAVMKDQKIQAEWDMEQQSFHINVKELLAIQLGLQILGSEIFNCAIHVKTDNTTAVSYINKMGGVRSDSCRKVGFDIWNWCELHHVWLTASHIPGLENEIADSLSRHFSPSVEWEINQEIFQEICSNFGTPDIDMFATRHNAKLPRYCSLFSDSYCTQTDAFSGSWANEFVYLFPPFRLVGRCFQKLKMDQARAILVVPDWATQSWYATVINNARRILKFPSRVGNVSSPRHKGSKLNLENVPIIACLY